MVIFVNKNLVASSPFYEAFISSDIMGKAIFFALFILSIASWIILIHKIWRIRLAKKHSSEFRVVFLQSKANPLNLDKEYVSNDQYPTPFLELYRTLKKQTLDILNKNRMFGSGNNSSYLSETDIDFVQSHLSTAVASEVTQLNKNIFILSTVVSLAPFLGLLGTVWGILLTFSQLQAQGGSSGNHFVLGGISLALTTTVVGLLVAIPALVAYNYLRSAIIDFETSMQGFANEILATVEMQYRKVDVE